MLDVALLAFAGLLQVGLPARPAMPEIGFRLASPGRSGAAAYRPDDKSVSTWRDGTHRTLEPAPLAIAAAAFDLGRPVVTRCVKLNNPWCIKRARWPGELGGDDEGHTAFASTEFGADAAANLLRTYYVTYGRKSALDIVRRWAPAECKGIGGLSVALAVGGLAGTLRARYLAATGGRPGGRVTVSRGKGGVAVKAPPGGRVRVSVVPLPKMPSYRVPGLLAGGGEKPTPAGRPAPAPRATSTPRAVPRAATAARGGKPVPARDGRVRQASAAPVIPSAPIPSVRARPRAAPAPSRSASIPMSPVPIPSFCGSEEGRIQAYASAISRALGVQPGSDLKLFDEAGLPTINLLPVMVAMSAVELGYLHAGPELAEGAVARLRVKLAEAASREAAERDRNNQMDTGLP